MFTTFVVFVLISQPGGKKRGRRRVRVSEITHHQLGTTRKRTYLRFVLLLAPPGDGLVQTPTSGTRPVGRRPEVVCYQRTQNGSRVFVSPSIQGGKKPLGEVHAVGRDTLLWVTSVIYEDGGEFGTEHDAILWYARQLARLKKYITPPWKVERKTRVQRSHADSHGGSRCAMGPGKKKTGKRYH